MPESAPAGRESLVDRPGYHSPQVDVAVRLNTNESPEGPSAEYRAELSRLAGGLELNRYPDRRASLLRRGIAARHDLSEENVFCANGSNEVLMCLLLFFGGAGRKALVFEPTYALHRHIAELSGTEVVLGKRDERFAIEPGPAAELVARYRPAVVFACSPNNPTGNLERLELLGDLAAAAAPGLLVIDEAYGQFSPESATSLLGEHENLAVVRTFSKSWALAGLRLGYLLSSPEVVAGCERSSLPYHLGSFTQAAGLAALAHEEEMTARTSRLLQERERLARRLEALAVETWPSSANFILFRPRSRGGHEVWEGLLSRSVLVREVSSFPRLEDCLRVTVGTREENDAFLEALAQVLEGPR